MDPKEVRIPNQRRVEAGRRNQRLRKGLTPAGRERLRQSALKHQPWAHSTGPQTPEGKAKVAQNGKQRQRGSRSVREWQQELAPVQQLTAKLAACRRKISEFAASAK